MKSTLRNFTSLKKGGLSTGFRDIDSLLNLLEPGQITLVAARPSLGKTSFVLNIAQHVAMNERKNVIFFSTDHYVENMIFKLVSSIGKISSSNLKRGKLSDTDKKLVPDLIKKIVHLPIHFNDSGTISVDEICSECMETCDLDEDQLDLIVIDYLQLVSIEPQTSDLRLSRAEEYTKIVTQLKSLAVELNVPILLVSLLSRNADSREDPRPLLSDLREYGRVEQIVDSVIFIYRDEIYNASTEWPGIAEIIVSKTRSVNNQKGTVLLRFRGEYQRFESVDVASLFN